MTLAKADAFFTALRSGLLGPTLSAQEVDGCNAILKAMDGSPISHTAYALATTFHETASTMQPVPERGGPIYFTRLYDVTGSRPKMAVAMGNTCAGDGPKYCGRGYVQLTWKVNYKRAGDKCGVDLVQYPDHAMRPDIAAKILRHGMDEGWFTGKSFKSYLPAKGEADRDQFTKARRIINGTDKAAQIADHAMKFQAALRLGGWQ